MRSSNLAAKSQLNIVGDRCLLLVFDPISSLMSSTGVDLIGTQPSPGGRLGAANSFVNAASSTWSK